MHCGVEQYACCVLRPLALELLRTYVPGCHRLPLLHPHRTLLPPTHSLFSPHIFCLPVCDVSPPTSIVHARRQQQRRGRGPRGRRHEQRRVLAPLLSIRPWQQDGLRTRHTAAASARPVNDGTWQPLEAAVAVRAQAPLGCVLCCMLIDPSPEQHRWPQQHWQQLYMPSCCRVTSSGVVFAALCACVCACLTFCATTCICVCA